MTADEEIYETIIDYNELNIRLAKRTATLCRKKKFFTFLTQLPKSEYPELLDKIRQLDYNGISLWMDNELSAHRFQTITVLRQRCSERSIPYANALGRDDLITELEEYDKTTKNAKQSKTST